MSKELIIDVKTSEIVIALLENNRLLELNNEKLNSQFSVGDIYLGKVKKIMPGLNAAFIDVGYKKNGFLHYLDMGPQFESLNKYLHQCLSKKGNNVPFQNFKPELDISKDGTITDTLTVGQYIIVQIAKEPISTKGPRLSAEISIADRNIVLIPFSKKVSISQKLKSDEERNRLKQLVRSIIPKNFGAIIRTVAEGKKVADLDKELKGIVSRWESAFDNIKSANPPKLILGEVNRTTAILRDILNPSFNKIMVNDEAAFTQLKEYTREISPDKEKIVSLYNDPTPIFDSYGVEKQIKALFGRTVVLKKGAYLVIEHTEALHVIDVNSGNRTKSDKSQEMNALEVNIASAQEIARQLKLRDMGGIIVVDFIDLHEAENRGTLYEKMKEFMHGDRAKYHILPLSKFGLMQITRQRVRPEMNIKTKESCPTCKGTGEVAATILLDEEIKSKLSYLVDKTNTKNVTLKVHTYLHSHLTKGFFSNIKKKWAKEFNIKLNIMPMVSYYLLEYHFFDNNEEEVIL